MITLPLRHVEIREAIIEGMVLYYETNLPSDTEALQHFQDSADAGEIWGVTKTECILLAVCALKRVGRRDLARELHGYYLQVVCSDD